MTHEHNHRPTERFLALPLEEHLKYLKSVKWRMENSDDPTDFKLLDCVNYDIEETKRKIQQEMLEDAVVIYHLAHRREHE